MLSHLTRIKGSSYNLYLLPFPTRRSSDLSHPDRQVEDQCVDHDVGEWSLLREQLAQRRATERRARDPWCRSEEHTSELQSPCNLVCRLLLEKKKKRRKNIE